MQVSQVLAVDGASEHAAAGFKCLCGAFYGRFQTAILFFCIADLANIASSSKPQGPTYQSLLFAVRRLQQICRPRRLQRVREVAWDAIGL